MAGTVKNLLGRKFTKLTVIAPLEIRKDKRGVGTMYWECQCDCGNVVEVRGWHLTTGNTHSCGCYKIEMGIKAHTTHGMGTNKIKEYSAWDTMKARCLKPDHNQYHNYGGRGIKVCQRWLEDFMNFYNDVGKAPTPKHSLDRIDNSKGYEPGNCRWATQKEQMNNTRRTRFIEFNGEKLSLTQWCEKYNLNYGNTHNKIKKGIPLQEIFI